MVTTSTPRFNPNDAHGSLSPCRKNPFLIVWPIAEAGCCSGGGHPARSYLLFNDLNRAPVLNDWNDWNCWNVWNGPFQTLRRWPETTPRVQT